MWKQALIVLMLVTAKAAVASMPLEALLTDLACGADHIMVGRVVGAF